MKHGADLIMDGTIILSGFVVSDTDAAYMGEGGFICPQNVREALHEVEGPATVVLSSDGGDPFAGEAIRAMIAGHPGGVTMRVEGIAASAASLIFMGAARRVMSAGSILMIHDPSTVVFGTEDDLRKQADVTGKIADVYAAVYGAAAGMTATEARKIMRAETWMSADEAVSMGFADEISTDDTPIMAMEAAKAAFSQMRQGMAAIMIRKNSQAHDAPRATAAVGGHSAMTAIPEETAMSEQTQAAVSAAIPEVVAAQTTSMTADSAVLAERLRQREIRQMAAPFMASGQLVQADVDALIDDGTVAAVAGQRFMTKMAAVQPPVTRSATTITRDATDTKMEGIIGALMGKSDGPAAEYRGIGLKSLAMHLSGKRGGFDEASAVRAGMVSTTLMSGAIGISDFAYITTSVMNRTLQAQYERRSALWQVVAAAPLTAKDFRAMASVRMGGDFQLKKVLENGEYQNATMSDEAESLKVERRGRTISLTFEAIINDDLGALSRIPTEFATAARIMENSMVWKLIRDNSALASDSVALFHASHGNLAGTAAAISVTSVGLGRKAMWEQRVKGTKDTDDFMMIEPNLLIVPPALEGVALQFKTSTTPATDGTVNPYKASLEPIVVPNLGASAGGSDTSWYLISSDKPPVSVAYLEGYAAPTVQTIEGMNPDVVTMNARHIFGAATTEYRGAFKNAGV